MRGRWQIKFDHKDPSISEAYIRGICATVGHGSHESVRGLLCRSLINRGEITLEGEIMQDTEKAWGMTPG